MHIATPGLTLSNLVPTETLLQVPKDGLHLKRDLISEFWGTHAC